MNEKIEEKLEELYTIQSKLESSLLREEDSFVLNHYSEELNVNKRIIKTLEELLK